MNESTQSHTEEDNASGCSDDKLYTRRRLLKAGVSAAPIVLTLASRPVLAWHCKPPSAFASANLSHRTQQQWPDENTKYISDWINASSWPSPYVKTDIKGRWGQVITPATTMVGAGLGSSTATMLSRLQGGSNLEKYTVAALLNIASGTVPGDCLTPTELKKMFNEGQSGNYSPPDSPGIMWGPTQIVAYLYDNWIVRG